MLPAFLSRTIFPLGVASALLATSLAAQQTPSQLPVGTSSPGSAAISGDTATEEPPMYNTDLFGSDLREIIYDRPGSDWKTCKASCDGDRQCRAWTYVIPGRTEYGECFLKDAVPEPSESDCCISGIKRAKPQTGYLAPSLPRPLRNPEDRLERG